MSGIDEIRKRNDRRKELMKNRKDEFAILREIEYQRLVDMSAEDVSALLSRLEIAQKALEEAKEALIAMDHDDYIVNGIEDNDYFEHASIQKVRDALDQLKE